MLTDIINR